MSQHRPFAQRYSAKLPERYRRILLELYQNEAIAEKTSEVQSHYDNMLEIFLHTHTVDYPIPLTRFTKDVNFTEAIDLNGGSGSITIRMPHDVFSILFQGEGLEPSTGHWITIRRRIQNPFVKRGDTFKRRPLPKAPTTVKRTIEEVRDEIRSARASIDDDYYSQSIDFAAWGINLLRDRVDEAQRANQQYKEEREAVIEANKSDFKSFQDKMDKIYYETFFFGTINTIHYSFMPNPNGLSNISDIRLGLRGWEHPLKTATYKIVNANIRAPQRPTTEGETPAEDSASTGESGGRFIIDSTLYKEIIKAVAQGIRTAEDPKDAIEGLLDIFAYQKIPYSVSRSNISIRELIRFLENDTWGIRKREHSIEGTPRETNGLTADAVKEYLEAEGKTLTDQVGRKWTYAELAGKTALELDKIFGIKDDPNAGVTVTGHRSKPIGKEIKVCTKKEDLPPSAGLLRHMLPDKVTLFRNVGRFRELLSQNGTLWTRILGSFVADPSLIEFYPVIVPVTKEDIASGWKPRGGYAYQSGFQLCFIWRVKPLRPNEALNAAFYNDQIDAINRGYKVWEQLPNTELTLAAEKLDDFESNSSNTSIAMNAQNLINMEVAYDEEGRVNAAYLENAFLRSQNNLKFGTLTQPVIDNHSAQIHGFKMFEINYPYLDATVHKNERDALTEKAYMVMRDQGEGAYGILQFIGMFGGDLKPGIWLSVIFNSKFVAHQGTDAVASHEDNIAVVDLSADEITHTYSAWEESNILTCMVNSVQSSIVVDQATGNQIRTTVIRYNRGKFNGCPTLLPIRHEFGRPQTPTGVS